MFCVYWDDKTIYPVVTFMVIFYYHMTEIIVILITSYPQGMIYLPNARLMLDQRLRRRANIKPISGKHIWMMGANLSFAAVHSGPPDEIFT